MNILLTTVSLDSQKGGGTAERTRRLATHLTQRGHRCEIVTMQGGDLVKQLHGRNMHVYVTGAMRLRFSIPTINPLRLMRSVRNADVIHILGYWNFLSVATAFLARWLGKPYTFSAAGEFVGLNHPRPIPYLFHIAFGKRMVRNAATLIAVTPLERRQILERFKSPEDNVIVVPNGVEEQPLAAEEMETGPSGPYVLFVGRLAEVKGPDLLVSAFEKMSQEYPDIGLVVAGPDFGMRRSLESFVNAHHLADRVVFTGHLSESARSEAYRRALFLVVPSRAEAMSLVALEAGIVGTPVLLTDQCGFDEVETVGGGYVVPATVEGLYGGLHSMLAERGDLPSKGRALRSFIVETFAWPSIVDKLISRFEELIAKREAPANVVVDAPPKQPAIKVLSTTIKRNGEDC
ncbi:MULTISPECIES: glycosyltransferase family 4 protein [unclassified Mesorhizobium]|uniref:glycosyltransferase family 4 protein n=1 Tax=unclassified Mesorhizobium TaxID=325217 RepID=UPI000FCA9528|nr:MULTISPECIES: glycosyltransferase family 4 protein [unclassified Mesorhizobium]RUY28898.1 glycosyltransferase [Mesorhizobium sp. M7A.F.Ca.US.001.04.2.1]RUY42442.1 glycosyltransferase [Mesorhizobium sp. M7A.F.Ca.US.001.04.1.1]RVA07715.1 glycosyltransferase [Mesorhizobium sp. M7A.F.Ca.US.001.02.1.1]